MRLGPRFGSFAIRSSSSPRYSHVSDADATRERNGVYFLALTPHPPHFILNRFAPERVRDGCEWQVKRGVCTRLYSTFRLYDACF